MEKIIFSLVSFLFFLGCVETSDKELVLPIDIQLANVFYSGFENKSGLDKLKEWPADTAEKRILMSTLSSMDMKLRIELEKYSVKGGYKVVERSDLANILISLAFLPHKKNGDTLTLPLDLNVLDQRTGTASHKAFMATGLINSRDGKTASNDSYHYYGFLLSAALRNFPADDMVKLFYPHLENSD